MFFGVFILILVITFLLISNKINKNKQTTLTKAETVKPIIGGQPADPGEWPFLVFLIDSNSIGSIFDKHFCEGSLISSDWIVTAAHCFKNSRYQNIKVAFGFYDLSQKVNEVDRYLVDIDKDNIFVHEGFDQKKLINDIALIKINSLSLKESYKIYPYVSLSKQTIIPLDFITLGIELNPLFELPTYNISELELDNGIIDNINKLVYFSYDKNKHGIFYTSSKKTTTGDSGGPLLIYTNNWELI